MKQTSEREELGENEHLVAAEPSGSPTSQMIILFNRTDQSEAQTHRRAPLLNFSPGNKATVPNSSEYHFCLCLSISPNPMLSSHLCIL